MTLASADRRQATNHVAGEDGRGLVGLRELMRLALAPALQPIVEMRSGRIYGYESLLRGFDALGFASPLELLDHAHQAGLLLDLEILMHERAIAMFAGLSTSDGQVLFLNLDSRVIPAHERIAGALETALRRHGLPPTALCVELSERHANAGVPGFEALLRRLRAMGIAIALDDFGVGQSEIQVLCDHAIDYVKIDRHFISGIGKHQRRRLFVSSLARLANALGIKVVAEGVEEIEDYQACRDVGCNLAQGYLVGRPTREVAELQRDRSDVARIHPAGWRVGGADEHLIRAEMQAVPPIAHGADFDAISELFRRHPDQSFFPVVDSAGVPRGLIHERSVKDLIYSRYGRDLVTNKSYRPDFAHFLSPAPVIELSTALDEILRLVAASEGNDGIILTQDLRYCGVMSSMSLLKVLNERQVRRAQDLNPLTGMPGNLAIADHIRATLAATGETRYLCHVDYDNFKPFNDYFGFADGDRAILLFARMLQEEHGEPLRFAGHVGGDDFFCAFAGEDRNAVEGRLRRLLDRFRSEIVGFYAPGDRAAGFIEARDRDGNIRRYPLMRCSVAVVEVPNGPFEWTPDAISRELALVKQLAKASQTGLAWKVIGEGVLIR